MSYCIYVGNSLTADGRAYLAGYGDEPSSHWLSIVPRQQHAADATIEVGVTEKSLMPGKRIQIPQSAETARHICVDYSFYRGVPAPITNGGLNEYGVAVRDIWSTSRDDLIAMTPADQSGPHYGELARIVLQRAHTAREGVELIGELIAKHGYSTYGGNSHFIADYNEGWVVIEFAGGQGLWVAQRVGADEIRVSRPGYIGEISAEITQSPNILASPNFITFAIEQGWYKNDGSPFNVNSIYGDGKGVWDGADWIAKEMTRRASRPEKVTLQDMMWAVRTQYLTGDTAGYGQVVPLAPVEHAELSLLWHTPVGAIAAPFVPVFMGAHDIPPEFKQHRYLSADEATKFIDARHGEESRSALSQGIEATPSAFLAAKRLLYLISEHHEQYLPEATALFEAFEQKQIAALQAVIQTAQTLIVAGRTDLAERHLTYYTSTELLNGLRLVEKMADYFDTRTRLLHGIDDSLGFKGPKQLW